MNRLAITVLVVVGLVLMAAVGYSFFLTRSGVQNPQHEASALGIATDKIEQIRSLPYETIASGTETISRDGQVFTVKTNVTSEPNEVKNIRVEVVWSPAGGQENTTMLTTLVAAVENIL